ncbi:unknown seed protein like 1 [Actinidia rufa]|uniref:BURP domain-containing protein n=1 Tax=Actinidia rufa TaxID=165716 RepID=A0A7J0ETJ9_9ERIC|nr:unknown seed protein like 1 [Actinidia rufa]
MDSRFASYSFLFYVLLVSQCTHTNSARRITENINKEVYDHLRIVNKHDDPSTLMDPSLNVFFTLNDLRIGNSIAIYFSTKHPSLYPHLLPREESDSIPFSLSQLPNILEFFSFPKHSPQAKAIEYTLAQCELEALKGETKFCATSLESMLDSTRGVFRLDAKLEVLTTKYLSSHAIPLQNYTVLEEPNATLAPKMVACHNMPYPYAVYYCHVQESDHKVFEILVGGENGERVRAIGVCHMDTSQWDPNHVAFRVLKTWPGRSSVCHFFPANNLIWVASPMII